MSNIELKPQAKIFSKCVIYKDYLYTFGKTMGIKPTQEFWKVK